MADYFLPIVIAIVAVVFSSIVILLLFYGRDSKGKTICLLGLSNSGKTLLFMRMVHGEYARTQTSMEENKSHLIVTNRKNKQVGVEVVDIPGNDRLRERMWKQHANNQLKGVIVVVDSVNFPNEKREVAHVIISALSEPTVQNRRVPVLIACNKQDVALALPETDIQPALEDEITEILTNPSVQLDSIAQSKEAKKAAIPLDAEERFRFALFGVPVGVVSFSARGKGEENMCEAELSAVEKWLSSIA